MNALTRALAMLALAALLVGLLAAAVIAGSDHVDDTAFAIAFMVGVGYAWIATGLFAWSRRPANKVGALMAATGFAWLLNAFVAANSAVIFTFAVLASNLYLATFAHLLLAYPGGTLSRRDRRIATVVYALCALGALPILLSGLEVTCDRCPESVIQITDSTTVGTVGDILTSIAAVVLAGAVIWVLTARWRAASGPQRRVLAPLLWSGIVLIALVAVTLTSQTVSGDQVPGILPVAWQVVFAAVPFAFLGGLLRGQIAQADAVGELLQRLGEASTGDLRGLLADALGDPSLQLLYWVEEGWVRRDGRSADRPNHAYTPVELNGELVGAIIHDASLEPEAVGHVAAAAGLAMRGERLEAALRRSRARIVEAGLQERRRLERNLHDGAQQRLVALSLSLRIAQNQIAKNPEAAAQMVGAAQEELTRALEELRELARGIHPAVLSDRGLQAAVEALAVRSPLPVKVVEVPGERLPEPVEAAAYFVIAEALTNVAKYAHASNATVAVRRTNGHACVEVRDDGVGGADPGRGSGLQGLADRVGALDGSLALDSPPGSGTTLRAEIPV
ncbi:histidine kinase [Solirubrobacter pauli]|uniref:histidine kinase n=1 Tax=Solirubrobacter pauli TaxID=166793 RepID=A0A660L509_9ACTN|nr:histidine kinase [Solirubrobacter pauli]RKQ87969.1 histidine kinase [Solirubrobacter pauli]